MNQLGDLLANPLLRKALFLVSPEAGILVEAASLIIQAFSGSDNEREKELIAIMDHRFAFLVKELSETGSPVARREIEIRLHELLYILTRWNKK